MQGTPSQIFRVSAWPSYLRVPFGYVLSVGVASCLVAFPIVTLLGSYSGSSILILIFGAMTLMSLYALPVVVPALLLAEFCRIKTPLYYLLLGALCGVLLGFLTLLGDKSWSISRVDPVDFVFSLTSLCVGIIGLIAGGVYWLAAGRFARLSVTFGRTATDDGICSTDS